MARGKAGSGRPRRPPINFKLEGLPEVQEVLTQLGVAHGASVERKLARSAIGAGLSVLAKAMRQAAPAGTRIRKSIATRFKKNRRTGIHEAKAGLNVGKKSDVAPHAHFFVLGTRERFNKDGQKRGRIAPNYFIRRAVNTNRPMVVAAMFAQIQKRLPIELARLKKS